MGRYDPKIIEPKWRAIWEKTGAHKARLDAPGRRTYSLVMFSYPSGDRLHVGHWYNYGPADTWARFRRMQGEAVFEPMGFDAFGLPAENYAIEHGGHPRDITKANTDYMQTQLRAIGAMYDWELMVDTSDPGYYRWTQWIFLKLFRAGLAYRAKAPVNWCPSCQTVLANEQAQGGECERCGTPVTRKDLVQWFFRITAYADRLLDGHAALDWPAKTILMQKNWIGRSEGAEIDFRSAEGDHVFPVFTTRPDTLWGVTYMVFAPEHPLVAEITAEAQRGEVAAYVEKARAATEIERLSTEREKTGVFTGAWAVNPVNEERIPIWIADYVLASYGTGGVMAVPAHDQRDYEFATIHRLPIREVIRPFPGQDGPADAAFVDPGIMVNSGPFENTPSAEGIPRVIRYLEERGVGRRKVNYRLRDWLISRQRYWGAPIPIVHCDSCGPVGVPEEQLPVELPYEVDLHASPPGQSPLAACERFMNTACPSCGRPARRESDTMDTFVDSSWYYLRYPCATLDDRPFDGEIVNRWCPVDMYIGGAEHACMHLLYARFVTMALHDLGLIGFDEPFRRLIHQGSITMGGHKMSKSLGNTISPDEYVDRFGGDTFRMHLMFAWRYSEGGDWSDEAIVGIPRFLDRLWSFVLESDPGSRPGEVVPTDATREPLRALHHTIREVTHDTEKCEFNTAISRIMELTAALRNYVADRAPEQPDPHFIHEAIRVLIRLIAPYAPHLAEELWERTGHQSSVFDAPWPAWDPELVKAEEITVVLQVQGRVRARVQVSPDIDDEAIKRIALENETVQKWIAGREIQKVIVVPRKLVNVVV